MRHAPLPLSLAAALGLSGCGISEAPPIDDPGPRSAAEAWEANLTGSYASDEHGLTARACALDLPELGERVGYEAWYVERGGGPFRQEITTVEEDGDGLSIRVHVPGDPKDWWDACEAEGFGAELVGALVEPPGCGRWAAWDDEAGSVHGATSGEGCRDPRDPEGVERITAIVLRPDRLERVERVDVDGEPGEPLKWILERSE